MDAPDTMGHSIAKRTRCTRYSGSYYIDGERTTKFKKCFLLVLIFLVALIFCVGTYVVYIFASEWKKEANFMNEYETRCGNSTAVTQTQLVEYERYFNSHEDKDITKICYRVHCFIANNKTITRLNNLAGFQILGRNVFADWCAHELHGYPRGKLLTNLNNQYLPNSTLQFDRESYSIADPAKVGKIAYDDSADVNINIIAGLIQWKNDSNWPMPLNFSELTSNASLVEYEQQNNALADKLHKTYLHKKGPFATELHLKDAVSFYEEGILPASICRVQGQQEVKLYVIVLGYGKKKVSGTTQPYWIVQPVGEKWQQSKNGGIMEISDGCYKLNNYARLFIAQKRDIDVPIGRLLF